jgi:magnesium-protoporphyrin IX monomethyl ester (oxidative) cyclase
MPSRALLVQPPSGGKRIDQFPLNLAYLASSLEAAGHEVRCLDMTAPFGRREWSDLARLMVEFEPHFVGVNLYIDFLLQKYEFIRRIRSEFGRPVIVGGPHPSCLPEETLVHGADVACVGEGERTIVQFAEHVAGERALDQVAGIAYRADGEVVHNPPQEPIRDLDTIPFPAYHHFPVRDYAGRDDPSFNRLFWHMFTSRGCPFKCIYCVSRKVFDNRWRMRSAENIYAEIELLAHRYGVKYVAFQDDEPMISRRRIDRLCELLLDSDLGVKISCRGRVDSIRTEVLAKMRQAGFYFLAIGTESGDDETLKLVRKQYGHRDIENCLAKVVRSGFRRINVSVLTGFPWERATHFANDIRFLKAIPPELEFSVGVGTVIPYPETPIYELYKDQYGFEQWWLKTPPWEAKRAPDSVFFRHWLPESDMVRHHNRDWWHYSPRLKRQMSRLVVKAESLGLRSRYDRRRVWLLIALSRLSLWLYRRWPSLERLLFSRWSTPDRIVRLRRFFRGRHKDDVVF